jgi:uncharacterized protein YceK
MKLACVSTIAVMLVCCGCSSFVLVKHNSDNGPYPGARLDVQAITHPHPIAFTGCSSGGSNSGKDDPGGEFSMFVLTYGLLDFPLSAAADTLLLPWDLWYHEY